MTRLAARPRDRSTSRGPLLAWLVFALLTASLIALAAAPALMPESYSVVEHSVSESAAQGVEGAWLARTGFLTLGFAVLLLAGLARQQWEMAGRSLHGAYGVAIIAAAAFSHSPWEGPIPDPFEDALHSLAAFVVGLSFTVGVVAVSVRREPGRRLHRVFDGFAAGAAVVLPLVMFNVGTGVAGLVQRSLFLIGYAWYGLETLRIRRDNSIERRP